MKRGRFAKLLDEAMGEADVAVDSAQRDLDYVVERIRRMSPEVKRHARATIRAALVNAEQALLEFTERDEERLAKIDEWRGKRETAVAHAPELVSQVDERIAALEHPPDEENEYRATVDDLRRIAALLDG